jgi:hypothetical protein
VDALAPPRRMLDLADPAAGLKFAGTLDNPIALARNTN